MGRNKEGEAETALGLRHLSAVVVRGMRTGLRLSEGHGLRLEENGLRLSAAEVQGMRSGLRHTEEHSLRHVPAKLEGREEGLRHGEGRGLRLVPAVLERE